MAADSPDPNPGAGPRPLRVVGTEPAPGAGPGPAHPAPSDRAGPSDPGEALARAGAEVTRARRDLPPLDPAAFGCYLGGLAQAVEADTEADPIAVLASLVCSAGVRLGPGPHVRAGDDRHPLLIWPLIVGRTSAGRKGASWSTARRLLAAADPEFTTTNIRSGLTSGEGLATMFTDPDKPPGPEDAEQPSTAGTGDRASPRAGRLPPGDRRLLVYEPEWAAVMARMRREGNSLSATLRAAWEGGDLSTLGVTARIAPTSHVGLLAHITPEEFRARISGADMAGGTYNRFLPVAVARSKFLPLAAGADPGLVAELGASLAARLDAATGHDALRFTTSGARAWPGLYVEFGTDRGESGPVEQFISRAAPNCLRIAAIHAALDNADGITDQHLTAAAALVRYSIASARAVFSTDPTAARLLSWIAEAGTEGRTRKEITTVFFGGHKKAADIQDYLNALTTAGRLEATTRPRPDGRPGRGAETYTAPDPAKVANLRT